MNLIKRKALNLIDGAGIATLLIFAQAAANYFG